MNSQAGNITVKKPAADLSPRSFGQPSALVDPGFSILGNDTYRNATGGIGIIGKGGEVLQFGPSLRSADKDINHKRDRGVAQAREADSNQPLINAGHNKRAANTVGAQLRLQYMPNFEAMGIDPESEEAIAFTQAMENHFSLWGEDVHLLCDASRHYQFGGMMLLSCREALGAEGETLVIVRYDEDRMAENNGKFATFVEVVSCDRLSTPDGYVDGRGPKIVAGRELDRYGGAVAYHVRITDPSETARTPAEMGHARVVRQTENGRPVGIHFFPKTRAGQQRSMPAIIRSLRSIHMLDKFDDAQLQTAVINALLSIFVESEDIPADVLQRLSTQAPTGTVSAFGEMLDRRMDFYEENQLVADGVRIPVLPPGDKIQMTQTSRASIDSKDFRNAFIRQMAAELNLTYEQFSGDYSETTFSSARAALIDIWRMISVDRVLFTQHVAYPIFAAFVEEMWVRGDEIGFAWPAAWPDFYDNMTAYTQCEFRGPGMGWVDPYKDAQGAESRQKQGLTSPTFEAAVQGQDFRDNIDQISRDHAYARRKGVAIPGMPEFAELQRAAKTDPAAEAAQLGDSAEMDEQPREGDGKFGSDGEEGQDEQSRNRRKEKREKETTDE